MKKGALILSIVLLLASCSYIYAKPGNAAQPSSNTLSGGKLQACMAHEKSITNRSEHIVDLASNMERVFGNIEQRVEQYYTNKVVPTGHTLSNYNTLLSNIQKQKAIVDQDVTTAQTDSSSFSCSSSDPKSQLTTFKTDIKNVISALKDYRTSINALIVAVHTLSSK